MSIFVASQMSMSIIFLYSTESWSISTALCVLSGIDETDSSSTIVWSCCCWVPDHGDCPVASSRLSNLQQRRPDDRKCWADNEVRSGDVKYLTVNDVGWECLRLVFKCTKNTSIWKTKTHSTWRSARQCLSLGKSFSSLDQKHRCTRNEARMVSYTAVVHFRYGALLRQRSQVHGIRPEDGGTNSRATAANK